jgi:uncharacterized protein (TIGR00369 family)
MAEPAALMMVARQVLAAQPFSSLLGTQLISIEEGRVELYLPLRADLLQQHGFAHGGVLSYAADNAITFAGGTVLGAAVVTSEYKINYLRPAQGDGLRVTARVVSSGKRQAVCSAEVHALRGADAKLCAVAFGTVTQLEAREG